MPRITASVGYITVHPEFHLPGDLSVEFIMSWYDGQNLTKHELNSFYLLKFRSSLNS